MIDKFQSAQVVIEGAGPVGLACSILLLQSNPDLKLILIDKNPASDDFLVKADTRGIAISEGSKQLLQNMGAWVDHAPTIHQVHVSQKGHFGRTVMDCAEIAQHALGHIVRYRDILLSLRNQLRHLESSASSFIWLKDIDATFSMPSISLNTCLIHADGGLFHEQSAKDLYKDYGQSALVGWLEVKDVKPNMAWERFTEDGPIAILPHHQGQNAKNFVWCAPTEKINLLTQLPDQEFLIQLQKAIQLPIGHFLSVHQRKSYPLGLNIKKEVIKDNEVWIGNAAQTLHPVAGQGLNLGLRDAYTLSRLLNSRYTKSTIDSVDDLRKTLFDYQRQRSRDRLTTIRVTDLMASVFTSTLFPIVIGRGLALSALQWLPPVKSLLARQMMFGQR